MVTQYIYIYILISIWLHNIKEMYQATSEFNFTSKFLTCSLMKRIILGRCSSCMSSILILFMCFGYRLKHHRGRLRGSLKNKGVFV